MLTVLGFVFLGFGAIGLVLPIWPTTPFVLLSVACFSSTPRIRAKIMRIPFFRDHIENYEKRTGLPRRTVSISLVWLWAMLIISIAIIKTLWISILLIFIGIAVTTHILLMARARNNRK